MKRALAVGTTCCFLVLAPAFAQQALTGENLLVEIPAGYELGYRHQTDRGEMDEYVPKGETVDQWSEMITVQLFAPEMDNATFFQKFDSLGRQACKDGYTNLIATAQEHGYQVKVFQLFCPTNPQTQMGEVTFIKSLEGKDKFYVVQKAWRTGTFDPDDVPLSDDEIVTWMQFLRSVAVCDSRIEGKECPSARPSPLPPPTTAMSP